MRAHKARMWIKGDNHQLLVGAQTYTDTIKLVCQFHKPIFLNMQL